VSRNPAKRAYLSTMDVPDGRSDAAKFTACRKKVRGFYRRCSAKSRPLAAKLQHARAFDRCCGGGAPEDGEAKPVLQALLSPRVRLVGQWSQAERRASDVRGGRWWEKGQAAANG
jgi:hypothetical protein